jgi:Zn-finger nucleic acid-binding protein
MSDRGVVKPSHPEDEYFALEDVEKKRRLALKVKKEMAADEQRSLKELHFMHCPKCGMHMQEVKFRGVDVDVCFACGGVFLQKNEIEHLERQQHAGGGVMSSILNWFKEETQHPVK